ncbi:hypothetical protein [Halorientalis sp.]|jgi:hypothetical protein|uniref:hypothetical protein n=1 Tax=Halorientalis sp. TaxID=1931229 RepID=UPI00262874B8|nr:hypothetical protein [Halorientalis sp.]
MSVRRWSHLAGRVGAVLLVAGAVTVLASSGPGFGSTTAQAQETATEATTAANATTDGSQLQTAEGDGDDGGGIVETLLGLVGGVVGFLGGVVGVVAGFLDSPIGHALVGIPLGLYLGLKGIALYLEYYD